MTETNRSAFVPSWLLEAWDMGQKSRGTSPDEIHGNLMDDIIRVRRRLLKELEHYDRQEMPSVDRWYFNSMLAQLGWMEVKRALEAQSETNRTEDGDQPPRG